jgi:hypothetical protein
MLELFNTSELEKSLFSDFTTLDKIEVFIIINDIEKI